MQVCTAAGQASFQGRDWLVSPAWVLRGRACTFLANIQPTCITGFFISLLLISLAFHHLSSPHSVPTHPPNRTNRTHPTATTTGTYRDSYIHHTPRFLAASSSFSTPATQYPSHHRSQILKSKTSSSPAGPLSVTHIYPRADHPRHGFPPVRPQPWPRLP